MRMFLAVMPNSFHCQDGTSVCCDFMALFLQDNALVGDEFMRQIEAIAAYVPYMVAVGNHENA